MSYVDYVVKHEHGGTQPTCECCSEKLSLKKGGFSRFCSKRCAAKASNGMSGKTGEKSPNFGKRRTEEQLKHYSEGSKKRWQLHGDSLREMMKTPEYRKSNSDAQKQSYVKNPDLRKIKSDAARKFWTTSPLADKLRKDASERAVKLLAENKIGPQAPFKRCTLKNPWTGEDEFMHSSWETAFFQTCIDRKYEVTKNHGIEIPYTAPDGTEHVYIPDFYGKEDRILYEVKGRWDEVDIAKWTAAEKFCERMHWKFTLVFSPDDVI